MKNKIISQIDDLDNARFEKVYNQLLEVLNSTTHYKLSKEENEAIDSALRASEEGQTYSHDEVIKDVRVKFSHLKFK